MHPRYDFIKDAPLPPWLRSALGEVGTAEVTGARSNPRILRYRDEAKVPLAGDDGKVPWCAIFTNAMLERVGGLGSKSGMARSYTSDKDFVKLAAPALGCIVVLSSNRGPASGHVGFYVAEDGLMVHLLGGNQDDMVKIAPFQKRSIVGFYWPKGQPMPRAPFDKAIRLARPMLPHEKKKVRDV